MFHSDCVPLEFLLFRVSNKGMDKTISNLTLGFIMYKFHISHGDHQQSRARG